MNKQNILSDLAGKIYVVPSEARKQDLLNELKAMETPAVLSFVNAHAVNLGFENKSFLADLLGSDWLLRDGSGMKLAYMFWSERPGLNMNGTDFIPDLLCQFWGETCMAFGTTNPNLEYAVDKINALGVEVIGYEDGFQSFERYLQKSKQYRPRLILLGMGMPKQESLSALLKRELDYPVLIINGGAILDFLSGNIKRSPKLIRSFGMEWVWRLALEPSRLWQRYLIGNIKFIYRILTVSNFRFSDKRRGVQ